MSGHTPGPWRASGEDRVVTETLLYCGDVSPVIADGNGYRGDIASIQSANHLGRDAIGREEAAANARLISAAPDLLEAAKCAEIKLARYRVAHGDQWIGGIAAEYDATVKTLRAAIAKATGAAP